jgi:hypothetical protein
MWDRIYILSMVVFFVGMVVVLTGEFVMTDWERITAVVGGSVAGLAGIAGAVSGIVLVLTTDFRT